MAEHPGSFMAACFIANQYLHAEFRARGAELQRLRTLSGVDFLWNGDPMVWGRIAPTLFPIVGQLKGDRYLLDGRSYAMGRHGFARDLDWELLRYSREACTWRLRDDEATRALYPFAFDLRVTYQVRDLCFEARYDLANLGDRPMPASLGAHPAFRWPLQGASREAHALAFEKPEPAPVRRLVGGLLDPHPFPSPVDGRTLKLRDELFREDALVLDGLQSRSLAYTAPGSLGLEIAWRGFSQLGLWTKPGAGFLCIEPWQGTASPADWEGSLLQKPGMLLLEPGGRRSFAWSATVLPPA